MRRPNVSAGHEAREERSSDETSDAQRAVPLPSSALAGPLLGYLVRHLARDARDGGAVALPGLADYLRALAEAARPVADSGNDEPSPATLDAAGLLTVAQLAEVSGHPPRTLRHWAACGRLTARRIGRQWLIDPTSLTEDR